MTAKIISGYRRMFRVKNEVPDSGVMFHIVIFLFLLTLIGFSGAVLFGMVRYGWFITPASMKVSGALFDHTEGCRKVWDALFDHTEGCRKVWDALFDHTEGCMKVWDALFAPTEGCMKVWNALFDHANASKKSEYVIILRLNN